MGRNMTAVRVDNEVIICDIGLEMDKYVTYMEDEDLLVAKTEELQRIHAVPDITLIDNWKRMVKAIIPTHAHLDHIGAIPFLGDFFDAPIICTPFTAEVLKSIIHDDKRKFKNPIKALQVNAIFPLTKNIKIELINMTHSTPQTAMLAIHTSYGTVLYANDFKFDNHPTLGKKPNMERLQVLGKSGKVLCLIVDSLYSSMPRKTPSESVAQAMLKEVMMDTKSEGNAVFVTTFSSHIARLQSTVQFARQMKRKVAFLGRSLYRYVDAAEKQGIVKFRPRVELTKYGNQIKRKLKKIEQDGAHKYVIIVTGHQGEPRSVLSRIVRGEFAFRFRQGDKVIFSCTVIPNSQNKVNRKHMEDELRSRGVRIFTDIHTSGHASREDLRDMVTTIRPKHIIPAHGGVDITSHMVELAKEEGYDTNHVHLMQNGQRLVLR